MDMKWVNEKTIEIWNSAKENYNLSDKVECLICIEHLISLIDTQETSMQIMENQIESTSIKTKELEKQLQKESMKQLSLLDQIKELDILKSIYKKGIIRNESEMCGASLTIYWDDLDGDQCEYITDVLTNQH